ncbi:PTS sugar transporter subunit IIA [Ewingella americana]|uniref:PTS sugar transporter subunit IIA n=1 Tax=Ewingella americana TaxID=41202 RepID=UPI001639B5F0|nr:PTS sugar transporter subunit IIA [Ewingella americana]QMV50342.1 PTS sugar transporter subunit IIA [Ewingella americana]
MNSILHADSILLGAAFSDKFDAIRKAGDVLVASGYVSEKYVELMVKREALTSTYMGNHLAIPHGVDGSESEIIHSGISVIQIPEGVSYGDGTTAYVVIGIAGKDGSHLDILNQIAVACMEEENVEIIRRATNKQQVLEVLGV